jgi:hypothetical protein
LILTLSIHPIVRRQRLFQGFEGSDIMNQTRRRRLKFLAVITVALCVGCQRAEEVTVQRIPKNESGYQTLGNAPDSIGQSGLSVPARELSPEEISDRMMVAIYPLDSAMWFFKLNGSIADVEQLEGELIRFFETVEFKNGEPTWELPDSWKEGGERPMRFATLLVGEESAPLELAISSLPAPQDLLLNINRWLGQMSLPAIQQAELGACTKPLKSSIDGALLFDVNGQFGGGMMPGNMGMPAGTASAGRIAPVRKGDRSLATASLPTAQQPDGWDVGPTNIMVPLRYQKQEDDRQAQISITSLPAAANEWEPNVKRWAEEVGLLELSAEELASRTSTLEIDGLTGKRIRLIPDDPEKARGVVAGMVKQRDTAWFIKLSGDKQLVQDSESVLDELLSTIKWPAQ